MHRRRFACARGGLLEPLFVVPTTDEPLGRCGRFDLVARLGEGMETECFLARSDGLEAPVGQWALLRLKGSRADDVSVVARFVGEARQLALVDHPCVLSLHDFGRSDGVYWMATEYVEGTTLGRLIERGPRLAPEVAAAIVLAAAQGVRAAHGAPTTVLHGDLGPRCALVGVDGQVKVRGFQAPSLTPEARNLGLSAAGAAHQAPEVLESGVASAAGDVWSLTTLLWELLTGTRLFPGASLDDVRRARVHSLLPPPSTRRHEIPIAVDAICARGLDRNRERRASIDELIERLDAIAGGVGADGIGQALEKLDAEEPASPTDRTPARTRSARRSVSSARGVMSDVASIAPSDDASNDPLLRAATRGLAAVLRAAHELLHSGDVPSAVRAFRTVAIVYASLGRLPQALGAHASAWSHLQTGDVVYDLTKLAAVARGDEAAWREAARVGGDSLWGALAAERSLPSSPDMTPLLGQLSAEDFAGLMLRGRIFDVAAGDIVVKEGDSGDSLYFVADGRLVVSCIPDGALARVLVSHELTPLVDSEQFQVDTDPRRKRPTSMGSSGDGDGAGAESLGVVSASPERVFLAALTAGDFFGEFSFLTGRPRAATVEASNRCRLIEISRASMAAELEKPRSSLRTILEAFARERVLEWMLGKSEIFSRMDVDARRALLQHCAVHDLPAGHVIIEEGELHDAMYFLRRGEVEVSVRDGASPVFIDKLGPGDFFGEIAALEGGPRRATVRTITPVEVFRIGREDLERFVDDETRERLRTLASRRSVELRARLDEQRRLFGLA